MKQHLFSLAVGLMTLTACTSEEVTDVSPTQGNAIGFENVVNKNTRAVDGDLSSLNFDTFMVYGYYTKEGMTTPIQIFNGVHVAKVKNSTTSLNEWVYNGKRYWVPKCTYYFYAYSCADVELAKGMGNPVLTLTNEASVDGRALAILGYKCDGTHQHDLVCAESEGIVGKESGNPDVAFAFGHALCKVKAVFTTDFPDGYTVKISNVKISEFYNIADYNAGTGNWSNFQMLEKPSINLTIDENKNTMTNKQGSNVETSEVFVIPNIYPDNDYTKLHFTVDVTKDGATILNRSITAAWAPKWEKGRIYKYNINITGSSAGIEPIVFSSSQALDNANAWDTSTQVNMIFGVDAPAK